MRLRAFANVRHPVHQDVLARRRDPSHAGAHRGAAPAAGRAILLGGGGGVRAAGSSPSRGLRGHPGGVRGDGAARCCAPATWREIDGFVRAFAGASLRRDRRYAGAVLQLGGDRRGSRTAAATATTRPASASAPPPSLYDVHHAVARDLHAIARNRMLTGLALGYAPDGAIDFGLSRELSRRRRRRPTASCCTRPPGRRRNGRRHPGSRWAARCGRAARRSCCRGEPTHERARSDRIAAALGDARVPDRQPLDRVARLVAGAAFVVGVDTGLLHLAAALGVPLVAIFVGSEPALTGPIGLGPIAVVGGRRCPAVGVRRGRRARTVCRAQQSEIQSSADLRDR